MSTAAKSKKKQGAHEDNEIKNYYEYLPEHLTHKQPNPDFARHHIHLPAFMAVIGGTGSGKTRTLFSFLDRCPTTFHKIILCVMSADEPLYQHLIETTDPEMLDVFEGGIIPNPKDYKEHVGAGCIIFDDLVSLTEVQQRPIKEWFYRGRKVGKRGQGSFSMVYISQTYYGIPKSIRSQANYIFLKKLRDTRDLNSILRDRSLGVPLAELQTKYRRSTSDKTDFFLIDLEASPEETFRHNFLEII